MTSAPPTTAALAPRAATGWGNPDSPRHLVRDMFGPVSRLRKTARTWGYPLALVSVIGVHMVAVAPPAAAARMCEGLRATVVGTRHDDVLRGTADDDVIVGLGGDDEISGRGGGDVICGGDGKDSVLGGAGADTLSGDEGNDTLDGGEGTDGASYVGSPKGVKLDLFQGTATGWGKDILLRIEQADGSQHDDRLEGGRDPVTLRGGAGDDSITGGREDDLLEGGEGDDTIDGGGGRADSATYAHAPDAVSVNLALGTATGWGTDSLKLIQIVIGSAFDDVLVGGPDRTTFVPGDGNDSVVGSGNRDSVDYSSSSAAIVVDLKAGTASGQGLDTIEGVTTIVGTKGDDQILGDANRNTLVGGAGNDAVAGREGNDELDGGEGIDSLDGGLGNDSCQNGETLIDCES